MANDLRKHITQGRMAGMARTAGPNSLVYVVRFDSTDYIKIGGSDEPRKRLASMQVSSPFPLHLMGVFTGGCGLETALQARLGFARHRGEWFWIPTEDKLEVVRKAIVDIRKRKPELFAGVREVDISSTSANLAPKRRRPQAASEKVPYGWDGRDYIRLDC